MRFDIRRWNCRFLERGLKSSFDLSGFGGGCLSGGTGGIGRFIDMVLIEDLNGSR